MMSGNSRKLKLRSHPMLKPYFLNGYTKTSRTYGTGTFGETIELVSGGTYYAGKSIHNFILDAQDKSSLEAINRFVQVCKLMTDIRHPNVVQFIGIHFEDSVTYPIFVVEQLDTDLENFLKNPSHRVPFSLKLSIFYDIIKGLLYLHERKPPIIHRDLTARNILLYKSSMRAKITDYASTFVFDSQKFGSVLRQVPDVLVYMPPEALGVHVDELEASLDIFSFGQIMIYTALQEAPDKLLPATYLDSSTNQLKPRSEIERREHYFAKILEKQHQVYIILAQIIERCLQNNPSKRPSAGELMIRIEDLKSEHEDPYSPYSEKSKVELVQLLESFKMGTRKRGSSSVEDEEKQKLEEKLMQARIKQLRDGTPGTVEIFRKASRKKPMEWQQCLFKINAGQLQFSELNSNKILSKVKLKDIVDVKMVEMTSKLDDRLKSYFEVHFRFKNSPPWQLRVHSAEERNAWMEAILPDSTATSDLTKYKQSLLASFEQSTKSENSLSEYERIPEDMSEFAQPKHHQEPPFNQGAQRYTGTEDQYWLEEKQSIVSEDSDISEEYVHMGIPANEDDDSYTHGYQLSASYQDTGSSFTSFSPDATKAFSLPKQKMGNPFVFPPCLPYRPPKVPLNPPKFWVDDSKDDSDQSNSKSSSFVRDRTMYHQDDVEQNLSSLYDMHTQEKSASPSRFPTSHDQFRTRGCSGMGDAPYKTRVANKGDPVSPTWSQVGSGSQNQLGQLPRTIPSSSTLSLGDYSSTKIRARGQTQTDSRLSASYENISFSHSASLSQPQRPKKPVATKRAFKPVATSGKSDHKAPSPRPRKAPVPAPRKSVPTMAAHTKMQPSVPTTDLRSPRDTKADMRLEAESHTDPYHRFMPLSESLESLQKQTLFISPSNIEIQEKIGQGQYGNVHKGILHRGAGSGIPVAIKTVKSYKSEKDVEDFQKEMNRMLMMIHPNIVRIYGLVQQETLPWIVMEYLPHGSLKNFLIANRRPIEALIKYMLDVAIGMHYVSEKGLVHRDLAARNIIVGNDEVCKVSDFGLLREIPKDENIYISSSTTHLPIRWMAPESLSDRVFSTKSDVWSYGILLWEMHQPDKLPYAELSDSFQCCIKIIGGYRLKKPESYPHIVREIMDGCWFNEPSRRPSFLTISSLLTNSFHGSSH